VTVIRPRTSPPGPPEPATAVRTLSIRPLVTAFGNEGDV
jgi:hypothetical protein